MQQRSFNLLREVSKRTRCCSPACTRPRTSPPRKTWRKGAGHWRNSARWANCCRCASTRAATARRAGGSSLLTGGSYNVDWLRSAPAAAALEHAVATFQPDVMHSNGGPRASAAARRGRYTRGPEPSQRRVAHVAASCAERGQSGAGCVFPRGRTATERYERRVGADFHMHFACSSNDRERLENLTGCVSKSCRTVWTWTISSRLRTPRGSQSPGVRRAVSWYPNDSAMRMFLKDVGRCDRAHAGGVDHHHRQGRECAACGCGGRRCTHCPAGLRPDVRPYIDEAQIYVCPIFDGGGTKLKILDALAMGAAIVAHPIACEGIDVTEGENVLFASTPQEFRDSIMRLLEDSQLARGCAAMPASSPRSVTPSSTSAPIWRPCWTRRRIRHPAKKK